MREALSGGVFAGNETQEDTAELRQLVADIAKRSYDAHVGHRGLPAEFDEKLWANLEETGLARLTSTPDLGAGPVELAVVLRGLARYAGAVPVPETDVLAGWLGDTAGLTLPEGPLTVAIAHGRETDGRIAGVAVDVPWSRVAAAVLLAARVDDALFVAVISAGEVDIDEGHNLAGEPRDIVTFDLPVGAFRRLDGGAADELTRRGAWARCMQMIGALDAAAELTVAHTRDRVQFGKTLSKFQAVQHALATMAGEIERARAAATLAVAAAADHGFGSPETEYAVTVAKVVLGRVVPTVTTIAHQLHGAIGTTIEHPLWLATTRAQSWVDEFGSTGLYARRLGRLALAAGDPWDVIIGNA